MSEIGFDDQVPSLPQGGGGVQGLGATFTPDLSTGTGSLSVRFDLPNGPNDIGPKLGLVYDTSAGNGAFGLGFSVPLPRVLLRTDQGYPRYDGTDQILLEGAGPLVPLGGGHYRPQVDGGAWRVQANGDGFQLTDRSGVVYQLGIHPQARVADPAAPARIYAWHLESIIDPLGNTASFTWRADGGQLYLDSIAYGIYQLQFVYAARPDPFRFGRAGFTILTQLRCSAVELHLPGDAQPVLRRWSFGYAQDAANGLSLLTEVSLLGLDASGAALAAPPLRLGYSAFGEPTLLPLSGVDDWPLPAFTEGPARRVELVDWNADGLPDILQIARGGEAYAWLNAGGGTLGGQQSIGQLPGFASATTPIAFADMDGDGIADLLRTDLPLASYVPRTDAGGFAHPIAWTRAPALRPGAAQVRLVDLDGDGVVDMLASSATGLTLYYRDGTVGWQSIPQVVPRGTAPPVDLSDLHVFLADMTGDGSPDIVRVDGGGVTYWPYVGLGRWDAPVVMAGAPVLPFDLRPERLILSDVDGDGVADLILLGDETVTYWINCSGTGFAPPRTIAYVPGAEISNPRLADMTGSGTAGLMWSTPGPFGISTQYFYLDFVGATKPRLLTRIDNGLGLVTTIAYTTSAREAARAAVDQPWTTTLPMAVPVVAATTATATATGRTRTSRYFYRDGRYDGVLREFAGFGQVEQQDIGDTSIPTLRTLSWFAIGVDPAAPAAPLDDATRQRLRAIRGRLYRRERYGVDGSADAALPYDRVEYDWQALTETGAPAPVYIPRLLSIVRTIFERTGTAGRIVTTTNTAWDAAQNITDTTETAEMPGQAAQTRTLRTRSAFAADPTGRFLSKLWRTQQFDGSGTLITDQITVYDGAPEGQVGAQGLVTERSALALSDSLAGEVYGASLPNFAAQHYFRRADSPGWWITQGRYQRTDNAQGLRGIVTGPNGVAFSVVYDKTKCFPASVTDPAGNAISAQFDYRVSRVASLTDASGAVFGVSFDALARLVVRIEPGDTAAQPTLAFAYETTSQPAVQTCHTRAISGAAETIDERTLFDGDGLAIERRVTDDTGEVALDSIVYNSRNLVARRYVAWRPAGGAFAGPDAATPHTATTYDALGRPLTRIDADSGVTQWSYLSTAITETDPTGKTTTKLLDATGRAATVQQVSGGRVLASTYAYDAKGNLLTFTDAAGNTVRSWYDCFGRVLRVQRPEQDMINVYDPVGNAIEARTPAGTLVTRSYDGCNRPVSVFVPGAAAPIIHFTYHDTGAPPPPEAGQHTAGGRCVRVDDESGSTVFDYDARGRPALKRSHPPGSAVAYTLAMARRADGNIDSITYPGGAGGPLHVVMQYNKRGLLASIAGLISAIDYDLQGRRTQASYANGTVSTYAYDNVGRTTELDHAGPAGAFYAAQLVWDLAGNLTRRGSSDPNLATSYVYDDLHRLVRATTDGGADSSYAYDDVGNLIRKSDVGAYKYGEGGAPKTCLTTAGSDSFAYTALGQMAKTPWGTQDFDAMGRLVAIAGAITASFRYDYTGARAAATITAKGTTSTRVTPDPLYAIENGMLVRYLFDGQRPVARDVEGGARTWLHEDYIGSLVAMTDATGKVIDAIRYDAFGAVVARAAAGSQVPIGFATGLLDDATGLLYLQARYYHPRYGRFISPDPLVQDVFQPIAWNAYAYCRNNPQSYVDPTGREWWKILVGALAVVALVVLAVVTLGAATPLSVGLGVAIIAGVVAGGVIGGVSAGLAGGSFGDVLLGVLVGMAVGGWAAFGGAAIVGALGINAAAGWTSALAAGAIEGTVNGAAMGFASAFAGGNTTLDKLLEQTAIGALVGAVVGGALGVASYAITQGPPADPMQQLQKWGQANVPPAPSGPDVPSSVPQPPPGSVNDFGQAAQSVFTKAAGQLGLPLGLRGAQLALASPFQAAITTLVTDAASGLWTMGYLPKLIEQGLKQIGPVNASGKF